MELLGPTQMRYVRPCRSIDYVDDAPSHPTVVIIALKTKRNIDPHSSRTSTQQLILRRSRLPSSRHILYCRPAHSVLAEGSSLVADVVEGIPVDSILLEEARSMVVGVDNIRSEAPDSNNRSYHSHLEGVETEHMALEKGRGSSRDRRLDEPEQDMLVADPVAAVNISLCWSKMIERTCLSAIMSCDLTFLVWIHQ